MYRDGCNQNFPAGSNILPNFGLKFATDKSSSFNQFPDSVLFNMHGSGFHFIIGVPFVRSENYSGFSAHNFLGYVSFVHFFNEYISNLGLWGVLLCVVRVGSLFALLYNNFAKDSTNFENDQKL